MQALLDASGRRRSGNMEGLAGGTKLGERYLSRGWEGLRARKN